MSRRKLLGLVSFLSLVFVCACGPDEGSTVSWSPSGSRVAFLSHGRPWAYDFGSGAVRPIPSRLDGAMQVAWSPREDTLAVSTANAVEVIGVREGRFVFIDSGTLPVMDTVEKNPKTLLSWHPSEPKLLAASGDYNWAVTSQITVSSSGMKSELAGGIGLYGPDGRWTLWLGEMFLGNKNERKFFAREDEAQEPLPLAKSDEKIMESSDLLAESLCFLKPGSKDRKTLYCFSSAGRLELAARFNDGVKSVNLFPNRSRTLFAESIWDKKPSMALRILDREGKIVADGARAVELVRNEVPQTMTSGEKPEAADNQYSGIAWSPNGDWLAWTVNGRLCLWNWRNDVAKILPALD